MSQGHRRYSVDVFRCDFICCKISGVGLCCSSHDDITAVPVNVEFNINAGDQFGDVTRDGYSLLGLGCTCDARSQFLFGCGILGEKCQWIGFVTFASFDDLDTLGNVLNRGDVYTEAEAVGKLGA